MIKKTENLILISNYCDKFNRTIATIVKWSVLLMISIGAWNVIGRYLGVAIGYNLSSNRLIEAQWYLFSFIFLLGFSWTLQKQDHVRVDILQGNLKEKRKVQLEIIGTIFLLLPFAIGVLIISINPTIQSWRINELSPDPGGLPRYLIKTLIPLGFFLLIIQAISEAIKNFSKLKINKSLIKRSIRNSSLEKES